MEAYLSYHKSVAVSSNDGSLLYLSALRAELHPFERLTTKDNGKRRSTATAAPCNILKYVSVKTCCHQSVVFPLFEAADGFIYMVKTSCCVGPLVKCLIFWANGHYSGCAHRTMLGGTAVPAGEVYHFLFAVGVAVFIRVPGSLTSCTDFHWQINVDRVESNTQATFLPESPLERSIFHRTDHSNYLFADVEA